jgi:hypothetical protein
MDAIYILALVALYAVTQWLIGACARLRGPE